jgi:hypothetical protein
MPYSARLTLLKSYLASIPIYLMSDIKFPNWAIEDINSQMANFFWDDQEGNHKYHSYFCTLHNFMHHTT